MAARSRARRELVARKAVLTRHHPDDPELTEIDRALKYEALAEYVCKIVDSAPDLTDEQLNKLAALLRPGTGGARDAA